MKKTIFTVLLTLTFLSMTFTTCFATTTGKTTCPKTVKAGNYFSYELKCPTEYPAFDDAYESAIRKVVYQCEKCNKYYLYDELIDAKAGENGQKYLICPECPETYEQHCERLPNGRTIKDMHSVPLCYGSGGQSWGCTNKITKDYKDTIPIKYSQYNDGDYIYIRVPGVYYLTAAYGLNEECDLTKRKFDPETRQLLNDGVLQYKKVRHIHYTHNVITVLGKVKFNGNKGKVKKSTKWIKQKSKVGTLPKPTRKGYKFKGWFTKKSGGKKISKSTKVTFTKSTKTYYAHWKKK